MRTLILIFTLSVSSYAANFALLPGSIGGAANNSTITIDTTGADLLIAFVASSSTNPTFGSDSKGNTWTSDIPTGTYVYSTARTTMFYCDHPVSVGTGHYITINTAGGKGWVYFMAFSGSKVGAFDLETGGAAAGRPGTLLPRATNELVVSGYATTSTTPVPTIDVSMTKLFGIDEVGTTFGLAVAYKIQTTAVSLNPTWSPAGSSSITSFKSTSSVDTPGMAKHRIIILN